MTAYGYTKGLLLADYALFAGVMIFEFLRTAVYTTSDFVPSGFAYVYTVGGTDLILGVRSVVLTLLAVAVYLVPSGIGGKSVIRLLWDKKFHVVLFGAYTAFIVFAGAYVAVETPFAIQQIPSITGVTLPASAFDKSYLGSTAHRPARLPPLSVRAPLPRLEEGERPGSQARAEDRAGGVSGIGIDLLIFNGDPRLHQHRRHRFRVPHRVCGFRSDRARLQEGVPPHGVLRAGKAPTGKAAAAEFPFTQRLGVPAAFIQGRTLLLETDPSVPYEQVVMDFARQSLSNNNTIYVFTAKGSPIYNALHMTGGVRFYILSSKVSYPKPEENEPSQILVPSMDQAVILDLIDKTISAAAAPAQVAIVFDSISDMVLSAGFEGTYKFVKQVNEATGNGRTSALFLMTLGAHDEKVVSFVRSLFPTQLIEDAEGLRMTRSQ